MRSKVSCLSLAAVMLLALPSGSAIVKLLYLDDIAGESAVIVQGTILNASSAWNASHTKIYTTYQVRASRYVKGFLGEVFQFQEPGGTVDNVQMTASGTPTFERDERVVLMLWSDGSGSRYECIGLGQGVLRIRDEDGVPMVDHAIPVRSDQLSLASAINPLSNGTSRNLDVVLSQLGLAAVQAEMAKRQREAR